MSQKIIGLDVDGVLANFFKPYEDLCVAKAGVDLFPKRWPAAEPPTWNWPQFYGYSDEIISDVWRQIAASRDFWARMNAFEGTTAALINLDDCGHECYFITDRMGVNPQLQTAQWLDTYGYANASVIISRAHLGATKGAICCALGIEAYVDDKPENIADCLVKSPGTKLYMIKYPYNVDYQARAVAEGVTLVDHVGQFVGAICGK